MDLKDEKNNELEVLEEELLDEDEDIFEELESTQKKWSRSTKIIIAESLILLILSGIIVGVHHWKNNPLRIAKEYVQGEVTGEWNDIYKLLAFEEEGNPFLSKKMFVTALGLDFDNNNIIRAKINGAKEKSPAGSERKTIEVSYIRNEEALVKSVPMIRKKGQWFIDGDKEYVKKKMQIEVTEDAKVLFDGIVLDESFKKTTSDNRDLYELPKVFDGLHYVVLQKDNMEKAEFMVRYDAEKPESLFMRYNEKVLQKAGEQAPKDIASGYQKAAKKSKSGRSFIELKLTKNQITVKPAAKNPQWIEVIVESNYEYRFRESEKYFRRRKTEHGKCYNTNIYSFDGENLKLEEQDLNTLFL